ncbi:AsmA family protein [Noviherbaspirillum cavernae]|nr:AsmA family protein [Noviherbaspirillum cavernae]
MPKVVKYVAIGVAALIALLVIGAGIIAATFDPNDYKPQLIKLVQEKKQRTLTIPGDITLSFFPRIGADLGKVSISERNNSSEFAAVESAKLSLALIPLLKKEYVVDRVRVDGLRANIRKFKDGTTNFDDLLAKDGKDEPGEALKFDIDSIEVNNAYLVYDDQQQSRRIELAKVNLETGKIANGVPSKLHLNALVRANNPEVNASVAVKSGFTMDLEQKHYVLKGLDTEIKGNLLGFTDTRIKLAGDADMKPDSKQFALDSIKLAAAGKRAAQLLDARLDIPKLVMTDAQVTGGKISGDAKLVEGARTVTATFAAPSFEGSPQAFKVASMVLDAVIKDARLDAKAKLSGTLTGDIGKMLFTSPQLALTLAGRQGDTALNGTLTTPLSADMDKKIIDLSNIAASFTLPNPAGGTLALKAGGNASANLGKETVTANLKGSLDESAFDAKLGLAKFSPAAYTFDIGIDRIDLDRYKGKPAAGTPAAKLAGPEKPMDLSALKDLNASGSVRVGMLKAANVRAANVRATLHAGGGKLDVNPLAANLYGGSVGGQLSATTASPTRFAARANMSGVNIGPMLKDALQKDSIIEGRGNVMLDVATSGGLVAQIKKGLNGTARLELHDGAVKGINIAQAIRSAKAKIGTIRGDAPAQSGTGSAEERTDFSEMTGSFRIANGVAHNEDLNLKSPLVRVGGAGDINIGEDRLDYLVKATVVSTLKGQGGPELQALKGVTIPVKLAGPYTAIDWHIDFAGMAGELAKQKLDEKKGELKEKAQKQLGDKFKGLFGK